MKMKKFMTKAIVTLATAAMVVVGGFSTTPNTPATPKTVAAKSATPATKKTSVKISKIVKKSNKNWHLEKGAYGIEFSDGSWAICNKKTKHYEFQPVSMGDWSYELKTFKEFEKCVKNYLAMNKNIKKTTKKITISEIVQKSNKNWSLNKSAYGIELTDGSWALIDPANNSYVFQPVSMGDWDYVCDSYEEVMKVIINYIAVNN